MKSLAEISMSMPRVESRMSTGNSNPPTRSFRMNSIDNRSVTSEPTSMSALMKRVKASSAREP